MNNLILILHILCGSLGLLIAVGAFFSKKSKGMHTILGNTYHWVFVLLSLSAIALALQDWNNLWWFLAIALFSYSFALVGYLAAKIKWKNWIRFHLIGQGGSFIAMVTALFVVNFGTLNLFVWFLPTIVGTTMLIWFAKEVKAGRRPKY